ncbi:uncharacterized protein LOC143188298 [Calliopsis andreniformis]|uniref:uncharacterized protein LOC143188298 n=1 Tax=Calliopsis andreniformis TaxID=337506 RepID=UPI003FCC6D5C
MVVFTCNNCGETLQKPKVAKHYEFQCRTAPFVSCIDCFKDFRGEEYAAHTKCISEAQRYGGKDYVPKAGANKGERKQQEWINIVNNILNSETKLSNAERSFLKTLSKYENIPRKKAKFLNFVRSAMGNRAPAGVVDSVWNIMETTYKNNTQSMQQTNGKIDQKVEEAKDVTEHQENNVIENQNNENLDRENQCESQQDKNDEVSGKHNGTSNTIKKKKKSKKRMISETVEEQEESVSEKKTNGSIEEAVPKKKSKNGVLSESFTNQCDDTMENSTNQCDSTMEKSASQCDDTVEKTTFDWKGTILQIVQSKGDMSLKKLQKKVISQYITSCPNTTSEKALAKFNKKLKKVSQIVISDEKVKLA